MVRSRKSHYRQVAYHAYSTYIQTSNQENSDQKPIKKVQTTLKQTKAIQKLKNL